jgi:hypothetical protein
MAISQDTVNVVVQTFGLDQLNQISEAFLSIQLAAQRTARGILSELGPQLNTKLREGLELPADTLITDELTDRLTAGLLEAEEAISSIPLTNAVRENIQQDATAISAALGNVQNSVESMGKGFSQISGIGLSNLLVQLDALTGEGSALARVLATEAGPAFTNFGKEVARAYDALAEGSRAIRENQAAQRGMANDLKKSSTFMSGFEGRGRGAALALNILSAGAAGFLAATSALQGNIVGMAFGLIFLKFAMVPVALAAIAITVALGTLLKVVQSSTNAFRAFQDALLPLTFLLGRDLPAAMGAMNIAEGMVREFGFAVDDARKSVTQLVRAGAGASVETIKAVSNLGAVMGSAERAAQLYTQALGFETGNTIALRNAGILLTKQQADQIDQMDRLSRSTKIAALINDKFAGAAATQAKTLTGAYNRLRGAAESLFRALGGPLVERATAAVNRLADFIFELADLTKAFIKSEEFARAWNRVIAEGEKLMRLLGIGGEETSDKIKNIWVKALLLGIRAMTIFLILAQKIVLILRAIGGALRYTLPFFKALWDVVRTVVSFVKELLDRLSALKNLTFDMGDLINAILRGTGLLLAVLTPAAIRDAILEYGSVILSHLRGVTTALRLALAALGLGLRAGATALRLAGELLILAFKTLGDDLLKAAGRFATDIGESLGILRRNIRPFIDDIARALSEFTTRIGEAIGPLGRALRRLGIDVFRAIGTLIRQIRIGGFRTALRGFADDLGRAFARFSETAGTQIRTAFRLLGTALSESLSRFRGTRFRSAFRNLSDDILTAFRKFGGILRMAVRSVTDALGLSGGGVKEAVKVFGEESGLTRLPTTIRGWATRIAAAFTEFRLRVGARILNMLNPALVRDVKAQWARLMRDPLLEIGKGVLEIPKALGALFSSIPKIITTLLKRLVMPWKIIGDLKRGFELAGQTLLAVGLRESLGRIFSRLIGGLAVLIGALIGELIGHFLIDMLPFRDRIKNALQTALTDGITGAFIGAGLGSPSGPGALVTALLGFIVGAIFGFVREITGIDLFRIFKTVMIDPIVNSFRNMHDALMIVWNLLTLDFEGAWNRFNDVNRRNINQFINIGVVLFEEFRDAVGTVLNLFGLDWEDVWNGIISFFQNTVAPFFTGLLRFLPDIDFGGLFSGLADTGLGRAIGGIIESLSPLGRDIRRVFGPIITDMRQLWSDIAETAMFYLGPLKDFIRMEVQGWKFIIESFLPPIKAFIRMELIGWMFIFQTLFAAIKAIVQAGWDFIVGIFRGSGDAVTGETNRWVALVQELIRSSLFATLDIVMVTLTSMVEIFRGAFLLLGGILQANWAIFTGIFRTALALLRGDWSGAWDAIKDTFEGVWDGIKLALEGALLILKGLFHLYTGVWLIIITQALHEIQIIWETVWGQIVSWFNGIKPFFTQTIPGFFLTMVSAITTAIRTFFLETVPGWMTASVGFVIAAYRVFYTETVPGWFESAKGLITDAVKSFFLDTLPGWMRASVAFVIAAYRVFYTETLPGWFSTAKAAITSAVKTFFKDTIPGWVRGLRDTLARLWDEIKTKAGDTWELMKGGLEWTVSLIKGSIITVITELKTKLGELWGEIAEAAGDAWRGILNEMFNVIEIGITRLVNGVSRGIRKVGEALNYLPGNPGQGVIDAADRALDWNLSIPRLQQGGIVTRPTLAALGEGGPEAVVPLNRGGFGGLGGQINIYISDSVVANDQAMDDLARRISTSVGSEISRRVLFSVR